MPAIVEPPQTSAPGQEQRAPFARRLAISIVRFTLVLALAAAIGGGFYLARKGFGRQWRSLVVEEFHRRGVEASVRRLTLDPFRGLIAQDVRIFDYKNRDNVLAEVSEISLDINYAAFFHRQPFLNGLDIRNAQITLPLKGADGKVQKAQINNFRAHIYFPPEQIYVSQAEVFLAGVRISVSGQLIKRSDYKPSPATSAQDWQTPISILQRVLEELQKFNLQPTAPSLQVKFSGDLADLENARAEATIRGERMRRGDYEIRNLSAAAEWADQTLTVGHCEWSDQKGSFAAKGSWSRQTRAATFHVRSNLDVKSFLDAVDLGETLKDFQFHSAPSIEISGTADFGIDQPKLNVIGHGSVESITYKDVPFSDLSANFSWDGERTFVRDIQLSHESGKLTAELLDAPNDFRLNVDSSVSPAALRPVVSPELNQFLSEWEWQKPPTAHLVIRGTDRRPESWRGEGTIAFGRTRFRGVWANSGTTRIQFADGAITYDNFRVVRDEGVGTGAFIYDYKNHEVRISNIRTSLRPADVIFWIEPKSWKDVAPYKFRQPPNLTINGVYQFRGGTKTHLEIVVDAPHGMNYDFLGKTLPFDRVNGRLLFTSDRLQLTDVKGELFNGQVRGSADISLAQNDPRYRAKLAVTALDFPRLTDLYYQYKTSQGHLQGAYDFSGVGGDSRKMRGTGKIEVTDGDVFAIPVFGPLSGILNNFVSGAGYSIGRKASASFVIKDGIIHTDDLEIAGKLFSMLGHGDIHFLDDKLNLELRIDMHSAAGLLLAPMYKLFEYVGEGSLKKPDWHPKRF